MNLLAIIGDKDSGVEYIDRPTVKVVIKRGDSILILNDGLLPGGGVNPNENNLEAIRRELLEELGATVSDVREIGEVIQYRNYLSKKYIVHGYQADLIEFSRKPTPQDKGEADFTHEWMTKEDSLRLIDKVVEKRKVDSSETNDKSQGKLYNLMTSRVIVDAIK